MYVKCEHVLEFTKNENLLFNVFNKNAVEIYTRRDGD